MRSTPLRCLLKRLRSFETDIRNSESTWIRQERSAILPEVRRRSQSAAVCNPEDPNLVGRRLFADNFGFYCSREYAEKNGLPRTTAELAQHRIIGGGGGGIARAYDRWLMSKGLNDAVVMHHGSAMGLMTAAKSGAGISALSCIVAEGEPDLIRCFPATRDNPSFLWLLTHARLRMNPHVRAVVDFLYPRLRRLAPRTTN